MSQQSKREQIIHGLAEFMCRGHVDWGSDDHYDMLVDGHRGYKDYTDKELIGAVKAYADMPKELVHLAIDLETELVVEEILEES